MRGTGGTASALVIVVPAVDELLETWRSAHGIEAVQMPSHLTVLYPFVPARAIDDTLERKARTLVRDVHPFHFRLDRVERFSDVVYLAPEPAAPFRALTELFTANWPEYPPYGGAYPDSIPHLTVAPADVSAEAVEELESLLPLEAVATELTLFTENSREGWSVRSRIPFSETSERPGRSGDRGTR
jgi:hypothetical protein